MNNDTAQPAPIPEEPKPIKNKKKNGRPSKFNKKLAEKIYLLAKKGLTDSEISKIVDISESTLNEWKKDPEFSESLKASKEIIDSQVEDALLSRAIGYDYEEEFATKDGAVLCKKKLHPDVVACIFWLKNRKSKVWRDKTEIDHNASDELLEKYKDMRTDELLTKQREVARAILTAGGTQSRN